MDELEQARERVKAYATAMNHFDKAVELLERVNEQAFCHSDEIEVLLQSIREQKAK
jgi:hypothetical protein